MITNPKEALDCYLNSLCQQLQLLSLLSLFQIIKITVIHCFSLPHRVFSCNALFLHDK